MGPYGAIWVPYETHMDPIRVPYASHMDPSGLIWDPYGTRMGPYGPIWVAYGRAWVPLCVHVGPYVGHVSRYAILIGPCGALRLAACNCL